MINLGDEAGKLPRTMLRCTRCNHAFNEPNETIAVTCPECGATLILPSRKDWLAMKEDSMINNV